MSSGSSTALRARGGKKSGSASATLAAFVKEVKVLETDANSVRGRDASVIKEDCLKLEARINAAAASLTAGGRKKVLAQLKQVVDDTESEDRMEKACGKVLQRGMLLVMVGPVLITLLASCTEFATRPAMAVEPLGARDLAGRHAVVTGGCGAVGFEVAVLLADAGAGVVVGCHEEATAVGAGGGAAGAAGAAGVAPTAADADAAEAADAAAQRRFEKQEAIKHRIKDLGLRRGENGENSENGENVSGGGWIEVWPLALESLDAVRSFAARYDSDIGAKQGLDLLVHSAATKEGCKTSVDGHDLATQVNYLAPFLLTKLLLPSLQKRPTAASTSASASASASSSTASSTA